MKFSDLVDDLRGVDDRTDAAGPGGLARPQRHRLLPRSRSSLAMLAFVVAAMVGGGCENCPGSPPLAMTPGRYVRNNNNTNDTPMTLDGMQIEEVRVVSNSEVDIVILWQGERHTERWKVVGLPSLPSEVTWLTAR